jgi:hypothetical protein
MRVMDHAMAALDVQRGVAVVAMHGLGLLKSLSTAQENKVSRRLHKP